MWVLLLLSIFILLAFIGFFISKVDLFLDEGGFTKEYDDTAPAAIVMGKTEIARQVTELLEKNEIPVFFLAEPFLFEQARKFRCLFALSEDDVDNIVLCKIGKKIYNIEKMICLCNDHKCEGLLIHEGIPFIPDMEVTAQLLYQAVLQKTEASS